MNKQNSKQSKKQVNMEAILYRIAEMNTSINIVVLSYISIVVLKCCRTVIPTCCRTVVWKCRFISAKKQRSKELKL